ncbi:MAG: hypothetical protein HFH86_03585 [Bacilli bacterium]|jgi:UDP-N-acetylglucosamine transferase subunit ALG13|nr:hypothetical protein [Bacilli bacterium]
MILVSLGTQDRDFSRLLKAVEEQILAGHIKERVVVQAGATVYSSQVMEVFDYISSDEFKSLMSECRVLITHGGVGTIIDGLKQGKKIIAAARLKEYKEHQNDHQKQIIQEFAKEKYLLELEDFSKLDEVLQEVEIFKPRFFESNNEAFIGAIEQYINSDSSLFSLYYRQGMIYFFFAICLFFLLLIGLFLFSFEKNLIWIFFLCWQGIVFVYRHLMNFLFFRDNLINWKREAIFYFVLLLQFCFFFGYPSFFQEAFVSHMILLFWGSFLCLFLLSLFFQMLEV